MKSISRVLAVFFLSISLSLPVTSPTNAADGVLYIASDYLEGYDRKLFKHWIDEDKNKCDTRAEVLIEEAVTKPKINKKNCALTGGKWISPYDNKTHTKAGALDIDHLVPLAEAWRSGAWEWSSSQRQAFANDLSESRALVAVTLSLNRSKGDKDVTNWLPKVNLCEYVQSWLIVKIKYSLSVDSNEASKLNLLIGQCNLNFLIVQASEPTPTPTATASSLPIITPGAFCSPAGAIGKSSSGVTYTCKTSATDSRNRWRQ